MPAYHWESQLWRLTAQERASLKNALCNLSLPVSTPLPSPAHEPFVAMKAMYLLLIF